MPLITYNPCLATVGKFIHLLSTTGAYIKSACILINTYSHDESYEACSKLGMKMFATKSTTEQNLLLNWVKLILAPRSNETARAFIDGKRDPWSKIWSYYGSGKQPICSNLTWATANPQKWFDCMVTLNPGTGTSKINGYYCDSELSPVCEFENVSSVAPTPAGKFTY
jgi:hypothetical protein